MTSAEEEFVESYRAVMQRLAAGVTVVAVRQGARDLAMTANSVHSVSLHPPMILFSVHRDARFREALDDADTWAVSILDGAARVAAERLSSPGRPAVGQLTGVAHSRGELSGAALLEDAQAWIECRTDWIAPAGDHDVVVGHVLDARLGSTGTGALVHHLGRLRPLGDT